MKRKNKSLIKTTRREPRWKRDLRAAWKGFKHEAWNVMAGIGIFAVVLWILQALGGG